MATLSMLVEQAALTRVTVRLRRDQFNDRKIYAYPDCVKWMREEVPKMATGRINAANTPLEQLRLRFVQWIAGEAMREGRWFHDMKPQEDGIWEMKTPDLRIFGWMYKPCEFIAVCGGYADDYKDPTKTKFYADDRNRVIAARDALPLDGDKFVMGAFDDLVRT